jgi:hypothetical protein
MKKISFIVFILAIIRMTAFSQSCLPLGITFHTQGEIDSFQVNYPGCTVIEGDVYIGDYTGESDITNLNGLMVLDSIGGRLIIEYNDSLTSLAGLSNLVSIGGQLGIWLNPSLISLTGLEGITNITSNLSVGGDDILTNLAGLDHVTTVEGSLEIGGNDAMVSLSGLESLTTIGSILQITDNDVLPDLTGLDNLMMTGAGVDIEYNDALISLTGLENIVNIGDGDIRLKANYALTNIAGLENIDAGSIGGLSIGWNTTLSPCDIKSICEYLANPNGDVVIRYNAPGCNNQAEVEAACLEEVEEVISRQSLVFSYPNPTDDICHFSFLISQCQWVTLKVFDMQGCEVATILDEELPAGDQQVAWNAEGLKPGIYFYRISTIDHRPSAIGKLVIVR